MKITQDTDYSGSSHWKAEIVSGEIELTKTANGAVYGHSWRCQGADPVAAASLFLAARKQVREWGGSCFIHFEPGKPSLKEFWERLGAKHVAELYEWKA